MGRIRYQEVIFSVNRFRVVIKLNEDGDYLGYVIAKPRNEKRYYQRNKQRSKAMSSQWQRDHKEHRKTYMEEYFKGYKATETYKNAYRKCNLKRNDKGFIPLNDHFADSEGHHISKDYVIFLPHKLHRAIYHDLFKKIGMDRINLIAFSFLLCKQRISGGYVNTPPLGKWLV